MRFDRIVASRTAAARLSAFKKDWRRGRDSVPLSILITSHKCRFENRFCCGQQKVCNIAQSATLRFLTICAQENRAETTKLEASHAH
jgi:hypothetical protein